MKAQLDLPGTEGGECRTCVADWTHILLRMPGVENFAKGLARTVDDRREMFAQQR